MDSRFTGKRGDFHDSTSSCAACMDAKCCGAMTTCAGAPCLAHLPILPTSTKPTLTVALRDGLTGTLNNVTAKACPPTDYTCKSPLLTPNTTATCDSHGILTLAFQTTQVRAYIELRDYVSSTPGDQIYPTLRCVDSPPIVESGFHSGGFPTRAQVRALADAFTITLAPDRGIVLFTVRDCFGRSGTGVTVTVSGIEKDSTQFYFDGDGTLDKSATATIGGGGGVVNVTPDSAATITAALAGTTNVVASQHVSVRAGWVTNVWLTPAL